jgi:hypothetical protein
MFHVPVIQHVKRLLVPIGIGEGERKLLCHPSLLRFPIL